MEKIAEDIRSVSDAQYWARRRLPTWAYQYLEGRTCNATTQNANIAAFDKTTFNQHAGVYNSEIDLTTSVLGIPLSMPVLTAPTGKIRMLHKDGEAGVARAAAGAGTISCHSSLCGHSVEEIVSAAGGSPVFYQLYFLGGREIIEYSIERA